jgi:hypothetical protein
VCKEQDDVAAGYTRLNYLVLRGNNIYCWGNSPDICITLDEDIILENVQPELLNSRGHLGLSKADLKSVTSWMVGVYFKLLSNKIFDGFISLAGRYTYGTVPRYFF